MLIGVVSLLLMIANSDEPIIDTTEGTLLALLVQKTYIGNSILFELSAGVFSGMIIWVFLVYIPANKKRKILRIHLSERYRSFKINILNQFFFAIRGSVSPEEVESLLDYQKFRDFFDGDNKQYWYDIANKLDDDEYYYLREIQKEMALLSREAEHVRNNCDIQDEKTQVFLRNLSYMALDFKRTNLSCNYDYTKSLMRFLWSIFAQWDHINGQYEEDPIQLMIDKI